MNDVYAGRLWTMRVLHAALCAGVAGFLVVAIVMRSQGALPLNEAGDQRLLSYLFLAVSVPPVLLSLFGAAFFEPAWRNAFRQQHSVTGDLWAPPQSAALSYWWGIAQSRLIIRAALLEGAALINLVAYLLEAQPLSLIVAAVYLGLLLTLHPTRDGVESWIGQQVEQSRPGMGR